MPQARNSGSRSDESPRTSENAQETETQQDTTGGVSAWFAETAARTGLALVGLVLLLFALGQAVGLNLLGTFADAITSQTGRWLVVAFFAVLLIIAAARWGVTRQ